MLCFQNEGGQGGIVIVAIVTQQYGSEFNSRLRTIFCGVCTHCVLQSGLTVQTHVRSNGNPNLPVGVNESGNGCH